MNRRLQIGLLILFSCRAFASWTQCTNKATGLNCTSASTSTDYQRPWTDLNVLSGTSTNAVVIDAAYPHVPMIVSGHSAERLRIDGNGKVDIGQPSPAAKLHVGGTIHASGDISANGEILAKYQEVAVWVPAEENVPAGTVVTLDPHHENGVTTAYDTSVAGVISLSPGIVLGETSQEKAMVATTSRIRVRVNATYAAMHIGDLLVSGARGASR